MTESPHTAVRPATPRPATVQGLRVLICLPGPPAGHDAPAGRQAELPPADADERPEAPLDLARARSWVAGLARRVQEVLVGRRPAAQLTGALDPRSVAYLAAWAHRGSLRPRSVGAIRLRVITASRVEGWITFRAGDHDFVAVLCLQHAEGRWCCRDLRVVAPAGGAAA